MSTTKERSACSYCDKVVAIGHYENRRSHKNPIPEHNLFGICIGYWVKVGEGKVPIEEVKARYL